MNKPPQDHSPASTPEQGSEEGPVSESGAARAHEPRYTDLSDPMRQGFALAEVIRDEHGRPRDVRILDLNEACGRLTGVFPGQSKGRANGELVPGLEPCWVEAFAKVVETGEPVRFENYVERLGKWFEVFAHPTAPGQMAFVFIDITERKRAEVAADAQFELFEAVFTHSIGALSVLDTQYDYLRVNEAYARACGRDVGDFAGRSHFDIVRLGSKSLFDEVMRTKQPATHATPNFVFPGQPERGETHWEWTLVPVLDRNAEVECLVFSLKDVTEREVASHALRESEARLEAIRQREQEFRSLAENSIDIIARFDSDLRWTYVNPAIERVVGRPPAEFIGKTHREIGLSQAQVDALDRPIAEVFASGEPRTGEAMVSTPNGNRYLEARLVPEFGPDGKVKTVLTITRDLTHRKEIEDALNQGEKKYRTLVEHLHEGVWLIDEAAKTTFVNAPMTQLLGYTCEEMLGEELFKFMDPQCVDAAKAHLERARAGESANYEFEFRCKNGEAIWTRIAAAPLFDEQGTYQGALSGVMDITERKRHEEELLRRAQEFEALVERSPDIIARVDPSLRLSYINPAVERVTGRPREWFLDKTPAQRQLPPDEAAAREHALKQVFDTGRALVVEHKNATLTGDRFFQSRLVPELDVDNQVRAVLVIERDIDDLKRAQQTLEEQMLLDPLTGVANRRFLERFVEPEWSREARHHQPIAVIMIDIDRFKAYNDRYGHGQGDVCLRGVATVLQNALHRPGDTLVRYGGEEFVAVLPECDLAAAEEVAERLRRAVETCELPDRGTQKGERISISLGVVAMNAHETTFHELLAAADAALYRAKEKGRNRVETSP